MNNLFLLCFCYIFLLLFIVMPYSLKYDCLFIHIPKCAGSSIEKYLEIRARNKNELHGSDGQGDFYQHWTMEKLMNVNPNKLLRPNVFSFTIIRNPYSKLVSDFAWCKRWFKWKWIIKNNEKKGFKNFSEFIEFIEFVGVNAWSHFRPMYDFIYDSNGKQIVNYVGRIENLNEDMKNISCKIGKTYNELEKRNKSRHKHWKSYYNRELFDKVNKLYKIDFETFGYDML